ncbi:Pre-mRNA-splicing factor ATP-dependent RNA helicase prp16 [Wickerhamiella sorbophila]|uniref:RNA helicase n=1 Tax=Wickerhamiella sorbophila TaxID=45607 RepID=A0A2T0FES7_9ASCO|nr:Pre-mRNA-splicing factor ATP-dependent RNA helicase prp16 [Wickerhamiella sorbophila]PRT53467.1 Pre-mRNA-splicing factor ATP-dependent RNA helicase prp16 [Wickerhamiella sorbophila]
MKVEELAPALADALGKIELQERLAESMIRLSNTLPSFEAFELACSGFGRFDSGLLHRVFDSRNAIELEPTELNELDEPEDSEGSDLEQDRAWYCDEPVVPQIEDFDSSRKVPREFDDEEHSAFRIFVSNLVPDFLRSQNIYSTSKSQVSPVRDPESQLARLAKAGSEMVRSQRQKHERSMQARNASNIEGSILGKIMGQSKREAAVTTTAVKRVKERKLSREEILAQRQSLPAFAMREKILSTIRENQVVIVIGETGSGKTTQLTQFLAADGYARHGVIACTQPRRVAAMSVAARVSVEMGVKLGEEVGYSIRFENETSEKTIIKYMTDGILLQESLNDPLLDRYSCIIIDEAHERALNTDIILGLLKRVLARRTDLKLIVTSATINANRFSSFFGGSPLLKIEGRTFPVTSNHLLTMPDDHVAASVKQVLSIHLQQAAGDILVFMTGQEDIEATCSILAEKVQAMENAKPLEILPIYSQLPADLQARVFLPATPGARKVIVATNIAETSLTVDGIRYVIDGGLAKIKVYNSRLGVDTFQVVPISQANAAQRAGRAGRTSEGFCYRMYTADAEKNAMFPQTIPEIQRTNLANTMLTLKALNVDEIYDFDFLDPPESSSVSSSLYELWALGALDSEGKLTELGLKLSRFPMDPYMARLIVSGVECNCLDEMLSIVSMMSVPNVFIRSAERAKESDTARERFLVAESDHLTLLNVYSQWLAFGKSDHWATEHFLHSKSLRRAHETRQQLVKLARSSFGIKNVEKAKSLDDVRRCVCSGYFHQAARTKGLQTYQGIRNNVVMKIHPTSALYGLGSLPEYIVYHELILTSQQYMTVVTAVDPEWLLEDGKALYTADEHFVPAIEDSQQKKAQPVFKKSKSSNFRAKKKFMKGV